MLRCVEEAGADQPSMGEVVGGIEQVLKMAGGPGQVATVFLCSRVSPMAIIYSPGIKQGSEMLGTGRENPAEV